MKRVELINKLIQEGISEKTLVKFTDKQIDTLAKRLLGEAQTSTVKNTVYSPSEVSSAKQQGRGFGVKDGTVTLSNDGGITVSTKEGAQEVSEKLIGNQKKLDKNHNGVIDGQDFKILKGQKKKNIDAKDKKAETTESKKKMKVCDDCGKPVDKCTCDHTHLDEKLVGKQKNIDKNKNGKIDAEDFKLLKKQTNEAKPSAGLSKEKKSEVVKKAIKGSDIGKKGKGFEKIADKAAEQYGSKEKGKKVAAAAMWKNVKREQNETKNWVKGLVENKYFHNFTSKNEIMELIKTKINENVVAEKSALPSFLTSKAIKASAGQTNENGPATAPSKPKTKPSTKPGKKDRPSPYQPDKNPQQAPQAESAPTTKPKPTTKPGTKPTTRPNPYQPNVNPQQAPQAKKKK